MSDALSEDWLEDHITDVLTLVLALFAFRLGIRYWGMLPPDSIAGAAAVIYTIGFGLTLVAVPLLGIDTEAYGEWIAIGFAISMLFGALILWWQLESPYLGTDVLLFSRRAAELAASGQNPYVHSMVPAVEAIRDISKPGAAATMLTPRTDGTTVEKVSYPAGSFLVFLPQLVADVGRSELLLTMLTPAVILLGILIRISPPAIAPLAVLTVVLPRNLFIISMGGINDVLWVLPVVVAMLLWADERWLPAGVAFGLAAAMKQQPWFIAPFLAYWLFARADTARDFIKTFSQFTLPASIVFLTINLPFLLDAPRAWLAGVFTPLRDASAPLITQGAGLVVITATDVFALPKGWYLMMMVGWAAVLLALYVLWFDRVKWVAWITPGLILWANYRSLPTYFYMMAPLAYSAWLCRHNLQQRIRPREVIYSHVRTAA